MELYRYKPFHGAREIRLMRFTSTLNSIFKRTTAGNTGISIRLVAFSLDSAPAYYGLSYCWGDTTGRKSINCDGREIQISDGLFEALDHLKRFKHGIRRVLYFWIDQICVNQADLDERSKKVQLMREIYTRAERTLIWLGAYDKEQHGDMFALIDSICVAKRMSEESCRESSTRRADSVAPLPEPDSAIWTKLDIFMRRAWFYRVWVIQEVALSRCCPLILCGNVSYLWDRFSSAIHWIGRTECQHLCASTPLMRTSLGVIIVTRSYRKRHNGPVPLWRLEEILSYVRDLRATDPRDFVYGLLGLVADSDPALIPDYGKNHFDVFGEVTKYCIEDSGRLSVLNRVGSLSTSQGVVAAERRVCLSWIPNWGEAFDGDLPLSLRHGFYARHDTVDNAIFLRDKSPYDAVKGVPASMNWSLDRGKLVLRGIATDVFAWTSQSLHECGSHETWTSAVQTFWDICFDKLNMKQVEPDHESLQAFASAFYMTIMAAIDVVLEPWKNELMKSLWDCLSTLYRLALANGHEFEMSRPHEQPQDHPAENGQIISPEPEQVAPRFRLFLTQREYLGVGPPSLVSHDRIFVLFGGNNPYILRKIPDTDAFSYVGQAYMHGLMEGEAVDMWKNGELSDQWVTLR